MEKFLGITKDGREVFDRSNSHVHYEDGLTEELLSEGISMIDSTKLRAKDGCFVIDMGREIGYSSCVPITDKDQVVTVYRKNREGWTKMVKNRTGIPTSNLTIVLKEHDGYLRCLTAYVGLGAPKEPWDRSLKTNKERVESIKFWSTHALLYNEKLL